MFFDEYKGYPVSAEAFGCARDHLVVILLLSNGQRSGVVRNLTYEEYLKIHKIEQSDLYCIRVAKHKTSSYHGAAKLAFTEETRK